MTVDDIKGFEAAYGDIPDGALWPFIPVGAGGGRIWTLFQILTRRAEAFSGWSMEALRYIYEVRNAAANGHGNVGYGCIGTGKPGQGTWPVSAICWTRESCRWKLCAIWTRCLRPEPLYLQCSLLLREPQDFLSACGPLCRSRFSAYNLWHSGEIRPWQMKPVPAFFRLCRWTACRRALWEQRQCLYIGTA